MLNVIRRRLSKAHLPDIQDTEKNVINNVKNKLEQ